MNCTRIYLATCLFLLTATVLHADGKMFHREEVSPEIPYQRALLMYADGEETLILQSKYSLDLKGNAQATSQSLSWIVPVPAVPELASMDAQSCSYMFTLLSWSTPSHTIRIIRTLLLGLAPVCLLLSIGFWFVRKFYSSLPVPSWLDQERASLCAGLFFDVSIIFLFLSMIFGATMHFGPQADVDVIAQEQVGIYNTRVVEAKDSTKLIDWLNENDFIFSDSDKTAFDSYISRGWVFVVAEVAMQDVLSDEGLSEGLPDPLILRFLTEKPVYPLVLTGTGGHETKVLLYLAADKKMECDERLALRFAHPREWDFGWNLDIKGEVMDPSDFFENKLTQFMWIHKFRSVLTPEDMHEDLFFHPAEDQKPFRGVEFRWN